MMRIGIMLRNLNEKGGILVYTLNTLENLFKLPETQKTEFILIYSDPAFIGTFSKYNNIREIAVRSSNKIIWDQIVVPSIIRREKIDLIYNPKLSIPLVTRAKKVLMIHGAEQFAVKSAFKWYDRFYYEIAMPLYGLFADKILTNTKLGVDDLSRYLHLNKNRFVAIHEGVHNRFRVMEIPELRVIKEKYQLPDKFILYVGGLTPLKNFSRLAQAFDSIADKYEHELIVTGFKRFKFKKDIKVVEGLKNKHKIRFCGFVPDDDLPAFYNLADFFMFPSLYEGFGLPVLEAMACGCPIITSETGCTKEVTSDAAILVNPYNVKDIADKMEILITDNDTKNKLRNKGFRRVKNFSWKKTAEETYGVFDSLFSYQGLVGFLSLTPFFI